MMHVSCIPLPLNEDVLKEALIQAKDWALSHGITLRTKEFPDKSELISYAPFTLLPTPVPRTHYKHVVDIQTHINLLIHRIANDDHFLTEALKSTIEVDEFTAKLFNIYKAVHSEGVSQPLQLGLLRSDYMIDEGKHSKSTNSNLTSNIKQIEINTIASSFAGLGRQVSKFHRYMLEYLGHSNHKLKDNVPENVGARGLANGLYQAYKAYNNNSAAILFLVEPVTRNIFDQRWLEYDLREMDPDVTILRRSFLEMTDGATLNQKKCLIIDGYEVAVVYFRDGYVPQSYESEQHWSCRLMMERSRAIKCPSIEYHLAGTKKVQQELSRAGVLERYIPDTEMCDRIRQTFAGQYPLDLSEEGDSAASRGIAAPHEYVLKPQLEGGGNNVFGDGIRTVLEQLCGKPARSGFILMEKVVPREHINYIIRYGKVTDGADPDNTVSELGIYGVILGHGGSGQVIYNEQCGHLLRTKSVASEESGVAAGFGSLDSPYLY